MYWKKFGLLFLAVALLLSLTACGGVKGAASITDDGWINEQDGKSAKEASGDQADKAEQEQQVPENNAALFDNQIVIDGATVTMPSDVAEWSQFGLAVPADRVESTLDPNICTYGRLESAGGERRMEVGFYNISEETLPLSECRLRSVSLKARNFEGMSVVFAGGITFGATIDEVKAVWGEPTKIMEGDPSTESLRERITYVSADESANYYELYFVDKLLRGVELYVEAK